MSTDRKTIFKIVIRSLAVAIFLLFSTNFSSSQQPAGTPPIQADDLYQWGSVSSFHGLPSERINAIEQTKDGVLWFGTERGLARFDGRRVQTITAQNLSIISVKRLFVDDLGTLWIGTEDGALFYRNELFQPIPETADNSINSLFEKSGTIYLGSENGAIFAVEDSDSEIPKANLIYEGDLEIKTLGPSEFGILIGTHKSGIQIFENGSLADLQIRPRLNFINDLKRSNSGQLWVGAQTFTENSGLYRAKSAYELEKIDAAVGTVTSLSFDGFGNLWVGTLDRGAFQFRDAVQVERFTFENTAGGLRSNEILTTFVDRENVVWFGTTKGVCRYDPLGPHNEKISDDAQSNFVRALFLSKDRIFAGTNRGLYVKTGSNGWDPVAGFEEVAVYSIEENGSENLLVGTSDGLFYDVSSAVPGRKKVDIDSGSGLPVRLNVRAIEFFRNLSYAALFGRGLAAFENGSIQKIQSGSDFAQILSLYSPDDKFLWIGTANKGVFKFDGTKFEQPEQLLPLSSSAVWTIAGDQASGFWFGTEKGLFHFIGGVLTEILPNTDVRSVKILKDPAGSDQSVWCATVNGLIQLKYDEVFGWMISRIDVEQGLSAKSAFAVAARDAENKTIELIIGTNRGVANYFFSSVRPLLIPTRILSKRLHSNVELKDGIELDYPQNSLAVEVAGLSSRTFPEQFQYTYVLRNSKGEIVSKKLSTDSQFLMENLAAGSYRVEIRAFDTNLTASEPLNFSFSIGSAPFPWTTLALAVLLTLAIIALIWAIFSQRRISRTSSQLAFANAELNTARLDLANEAERERRRISRDLHDQTLADLRHLMLLTDKLPVAEESAENTAVLRSEIENVSNEIRNICEDLSPSVLENIGFTASLEWALSSAIRDSKGITSHEFFCGENIDDRLTFSPTVQIQIYRIVQEVLSNITQHSEATHIAISLKKPVGEKFVLTIRENGKGFDIDSLKAAKGRGLNNIQARANLIDAEISWRRFDGGMEFLLTKA